VADLNDPSGLFGERYERLGVLGRGGQGIVYRALDRWMQREVAIKVLSSKAARQPAMAERLSREQQALSALKGTAAVEVLDIYRGSAGELCLVMELLNGTDLDEYLFRMGERHERLPLRRVVEIFDPIVDTLEVAHRAGILHRDLKPANVFLLESGGVRLLDFGMARLKKAAPLTAAGTVMGSPSFMAPEAWRGQSELVDQRADVYSLGVILFFALAGELPFSGQSLQEKFSKTTTSARPSLVAKRPDLPADADEWVALALAINREERFQSVRALWNAFLATFDIDPRNRAKVRPSLWAAAKETVKKIAEIAAGSEPEVPSRSQPEPSFASAALAKSVMNVNEETSAERAERTVELVPPPAREEVTIPIPRTPPVEKTLELSSGELVAREDTEPATVRREPPDEPGHGRRG